MTDTPTVSDQPARDRIVADLDTNMLVEAGAGSGKTTSLVDRLVALVASGAPVESIAAVTFTRKAANELRERFQLRLEQRAREEPVGSELAPRYDRALRELDRAFLGTIHSFCGRLLHERPLEVALDPNFQELSEDDLAELKQSFWRRWVERAKRAGDSDLAALRQVGVDPSTLYDGFDIVSRYPDVDFPTGDAGTPDIAPCSRALKSLLTSARALMPKGVPADGWDPLMRLVRRLDLDSQRNDWSSEVVFCRAIERITSTQCKLIQKRWSDSKEGKAAAKQLGEEFLALLGGPIAEVLRCWREHRYPVVMRVLRRAAGDFERERHATGQLGFEDLLLLAARLLREHPDVRDDLGDRYPHLLIDEFQDTDPLQAEVCFLLASRSDEGSDWRTVTPRPGGLFVVGDPKQSIYRFRRADIQTYEFVKQRLAACGAVLALTRNFRSVLPIEQFVNEHFAGVFPVAATPVQAPYSPMQTVKEAVTGVDGVFHYSVRPEGRSKEAIFELDTAMVASWIAERIERGERTADDFLVLTYNKAAIGSYARALAERNIPVTTTGAQLPQEHELQELLVVLRAIADPENGVFVVAALEGLFFGLSPADLFDYSERGFSITHRPGKEEHTVGRALLLLHEWWKLSQRHPADVLVERILDDTGLLYHAASQPLGDARAGALLHMVDVLRTASARGASGITDAMDRIAVLLQAEAADAPLRPGRVDAVRVMNLHKAKGLEAEVVILAAPTASNPRLPTVHVQRSEADRPSGGLVIQFKEAVGGGDPLTIAQPPRWAGMQATEMEFESAERGRLLYVAATRAKRELVVARCERSIEAGPVPDGSIWSPLGPTLDGLALQIDLPMNQAPGRRRLERETSTIQGAAAEAEARVRTASSPTTRVDTVTESAKQQREIRRAYDLPSGGAGPAWGRAVHRTLEAMGRGRTGENLRAFIAAVCSDEKLGAEERDALEVLASNVAQSEAWKSLLAYGPPQFELPIMQRVRDGEIEVLTEGVIDAAASGADGWLVVDWKSDDVDDATWRAREAQYSRQVGRYAEILTALTGAAARGRIERVRLQGGEG